MSRAASAYAVREDIDLFEDAPEPPGSKPVRVLGTGSKGYMGPVEELLPLYAPRAVAAYQPPSARYEPPANSLPATAPDEDLPYYAYTNGIVIGERPANYVRARVSRLLLGGLVGLAAVAMLMFGAPALAHSGPSGLRLSGYRDVAAGVAAPAKAENGAPIIDVTSGQPAPDVSQQPQPATANVVISPPAASAYALEGAPTLSVRQIEAVLRQYGSPAAGSGQKMYDLGVKYGINPAFALAFFVHESGCGTQGVARFSKSLGNIRWTEGFDSYEGYRSYPSWAAGMEDWYVLIKTLYIEGWGLRTVDAIIPTYAPSADRNDPAAYIASVKQLVDSWRGK